MRIRVLLLAALGLSFSPASVCAAEPTAEQKNDFAAFLKKVAEAEALNDPVQRCIAYPSIPGLEWPKSHIDAHCHYHHDPIISLKQMQALADAGEFNKLEMAFAELQARHTDTNNQSEVIHRAFEYLAYAEAEKLTEAWLKHSPESAYALTARADNLRASAWRARGGNYISETPKENIKQMSNYAQKAIALYQKAIKLNPQLMPAYSGLINTSMVDSESTIEIETLVKALSIDNQCAELFRRTLTALSPRWGGSLDAMLGFQEKYVLPSIISRPLNAQYMAYAYEDFVNNARTAGKTAEELTPYILKGLALGANEDLLDEAERLYRKNGQYDLANIYISQVIRFRGGTAIDYGNMGNIMLHFGIIEQGAHFLNKALEIEPGNLYAHYRLGSYYHYKQNWQKAISHAQMAKDHEAYGQHSMQILTESLYFDKKPLEAIPHAIEMTKRFPNAPESWGTRLMCEITLTNYTDAKKSLARLKSLIKPDDKRFQSLIDVTESALKAIN